MGRGWEQWGKRGESGNNWKGKKRVEGRETGGVVKKWEKDNWTSILFLFSFSLIGSLVLHLRLAPFLTLHPFVCHCFQVCISSSYSIPPSIWLYIFPVPSLTPTSSSPLSPALSRLCWGVPVLRASQCTIPFHPTPGSLSHTYANTQTQTQTPRIHPWLPPA